MTEFEFSRLKEGTVVEYRFDQNKYYEIYYYEEFDHYYVGRDLNNKKKMIRIDKSNCDMWKIAGRRL